MGLLKHEADKINFIANIFEIAIWEVEMVGFFRLPNAEGR